MEEEGDHERLVYGVKLSSTVPMKITGEDKVHELSNMDLAMKLHYVRGVYFFKKEAVGALTNLGELKDSTFPWLELFYMASGRIRRHPETGRPFIKCNDGGMRCVEAQCGKTMEEWLAMEEDLHSLNQQLAYSVPLGPKLFLSPLLYFQVTQFRCGGVSLGFSWAHVLGDAFSAIACINVYGQFLPGHGAPRSFKLPSDIVPKPKPGLRNAREPLCVKRLTNAVGDHWIVPPIASNSHHTRKMETHSFRVFAKHLETMNKSIDPFHAISALFWKMLARVKGGSSLMRIVTIHGSRGNEIPKNEQRIGVTEAGSCHVAEADLAELVELIRAKTRGSGNEKEAIEEVMEKEKGNVDFVLYGASLTFLDLAEADVYGLEIYGHKPILATYAIEGVGEEGVVLVMPLPPNNEESGCHGRRGGAGCDRGRMVTVTLVENQLAELKSELKREWGIV